MKKILTWVTALALTVGLATGCSANSSNSQNTNSPSSTSANNSSNAQDVEIHYAYWQESLSGYLAEAQKAFEAQNPGVKIILEPTAWSEYWTKIETAATGGSVADVFHMNGVNISKYASGDVLLPLDDRISASSVDLKNYPEAMVELYNLSDKQYGIPLDYDTIGLWYNKSLFDAANVPYPTSDWTWEDLASAAEKLTDADKGIYGINAGYADQQNFYNTVFATGGYIVDGETFGFDDPNTRKGLQVWYDLMKAGVSPSEISLEENEGYLQFMSGKLAMTFAGDWMVSFFSSEDSAVADVCDVVELPTLGGKRASVIHGKANVISASTAHPDEAFKWVEFLGNAEANEILGKSGVAIPAHLDYSGLFFEQYPQYNMNIYLDAAKNYSYKYPSSTSQVPWADIMWTELVRAFKLDITIDQACDNIMDQIEAAS